MKCEKCGCEDYYVYKDEENDNKRTKECMNCGEILYVEEDWEVEV